MPGIVWEYKYWTKDYATANLQLFDPWVEKLWNNPPTCFLISSTWGRQGILFISISSLINAFVWAEKVESKSELEHTITAWGGIIGTISSSIGISCTNTTFCTGWPLSSIERCLIGFIGLTLLLWSMKLNLNLCAI